MQKVITIDNGKLLPLQHGEEKKEKWEQGSWKKKESKEKWKENVMVLDRMVSKFSKSKFSDSIEREIKILSKYCVSKQLFVQE